MSEKEIRLRDDQRFCTVKGPGCRVITKHKSDKCENCRTSSCIDCGKVYVNQSGGKRCGKCAREKILRDAAKERNL